MSESPASDHSPPGARGARGARLLAAVEEGDTEEVIRQLQNAKVLPNVCNMHGESALHIAAGNGKLGIVDALCKNNATLNITDKQGDTPLYWAARHGHLEVVQYLCNNGADVNYRDTTGETALHVCARYDQPDVLAHLCKAGAKLDLPDKDGDTPLLCGVWHGYQSVVELLVRGGCSLHCCNRDGETPLHVAAVRGYYTLVKFFCENGADVDVQDRLGCTAVQLSVRRSHSDIVQYLCKMKCNTNIRNLNGDTPLHDACREGHLSIFLTLLEANTNLDIPNKNKATPFHLAAKYGHSELIRYLCLAGCNIDAVTENGFTADEVAANASHNDMASVIHHLRQGGMCNEYINDLTPGQASITRSKLSVCGAPGVGKTELINSLKCRFIHSLFRRRSASSLSHTIEQRTYGMSVQQLTIPNAGDFNVWDFSGVRSYYPLHEEFLQTKNTVFLVVFSLCDPPERQLAQIRFWLAMIKAKQPQSETIRFAGEIENKPNVILVSSFADQARLPTLSEEASKDIFSFPSASSIAQPHSERIGRGSDILEVLEREFKDYFSFSRQLFALDCRLSQSSGIRALRQHLGAVRLELIQSQPKTLKVVEVLSHAIANWKEEHNILPVLTWSVFLQKTRQYINPLISEHLMVTAVSALHDMGEIIYINKGSLCNIIILDPAWLGLSIFGPALSPENTVMPQLKSVTGRITPSILQRTYPQWDTTSLLNLFEHFELCLPLDDQRQSYLFPCLIKMESLYGLWEKDVDFTVYAGLQVVCQTDLDIFSPSLFTKIQLRARREFSDDIEDQELTLWSGGLKCCRGEVEILMRYPQLHKTIEILVRSTEETRFDCYALLQQFYSIVIQTITRVNPGTAFTTEIISSKRLKEHKPIITYSLAEIFAAERGDGVLIHRDMPGVQEHILDLLCCGCEELLATAKSAPHVSLQDLSIQTKAKLSQLLDPPDSFGRDWCLLSLQLLFTEEVPRIHQAKDQTSPTDRLLTAWGRNARSTVVTVVDALRGIGRGDAADVLIKGLSPFSNPSNSIVISVPGVPMTSYLC